MDDADIRRLVAGLGDFGWMHPPQTMVDSAAWDQYWHDQLTRGAAGFVHLFVNDGELVDAMRAHRLRTVLCVGNGISQEPKALALAGFDVIALDLSPLATEVARDGEPTDEMLVRLIGGRSPGKGGQVRFVSGDLLDPTVCPGPYDVVIERKTLQLYPADQQTPAIRAVANRVGSPGIMFSQTHRNGPPSRWQYPVSDWLRQEGWPLFREVTTLTQRAGWIFMTSG